MADQEQLERLRQGVALWNAWRKEHPEIVIDLAGVNLAGANLEGAILVDVNLFEANLEGANLSRANLAGADLERAILKRAIFEWTILKGAILWGVRLEGANLTRAMLREANLWGARLEGANLREANLRETNLERVDLTRAVLIDANLFEANLKGAILEEVNLTGARLHRTDVTHALVEGTNFDNLDLSEVDGLETVQHAGPSTIGIDTLYRSQGNIPEVFLRGCGVPDPMIEFARSLVLAARPIDYYSCFISYSHADKSFARRLYDALQGRGIRCWLDEHQLLPGHDIYDEVERGIRLWDKILLCASEHSLTSWWVDNEIDNAFAKERQFTKQRGRQVRALIPLNLDNALWQWQDGRANKVRSRLAADFTGWEHDNAKFEREFERLVKALRTDEGREEPPKPRL